MAGPIGLRFVNHVRRAIGQDQVQASGPGIAADDLAECPQAMRMVIGLQTIPPHRPIIHVQRHQERDGPLPLVLELPSGDLPATHRLGGTTPHLHLHRGFFIQAAHHLIARAEPFNPFIPPQHLGGLGDEALVNGRRFPIAAAVGLQASLYQDPRHCGAMHKPHTHLFHRHPL